MGLLTELFVGTEDDARAYGPASAEKLHALQLGGLTNLEFETLWAVIAGEKWDVKKHKLRQVAASKEHWTFAFPEAYVALLGGIQEPGIESAASAWAKTPEINGRPTDVEPIIRQLVRLSQEATRKKQGLCLWVSL